MLVPHRILTDQTRMDQLPSLVWTVLQQELQGEAESTRWSQLIFSSFQWNGCNTLNYMGGGLFMVALFQMVSKKKQR